MLRHGTYRPTSTSWRVVVGAEPELNDARTRGLRGRADLCNMAQNGNQCHQCQE